MQELKEFARYTRDGLVAELFAGPGDLKKASRPRHMYSSKHENGRVMVVAGSKDYHGAPVLAANAVYNTLAALRIGIGYAYLYVPKAMESTARNLSPNIIVRRFGTDYISDGDMAEIKEEMKRIDSLVIGMGIGRNEETLATASRIINHAIAIKKKIVIDADAIYSLKRVPRLTSNVILTPQDREFHELSKSNLKKGALGQRLRSAIALAKKLHSNVLLKGHETIVTNGAIVKIVRSESSALATMGTGDVLSGIIGGYMAIDASTFEAGVAGAYLHSRIGDRLAIEKGTHILAVDVVDAIPKLIKEFDENTQ